MSFRLIYNERIKRGLLQGILPLPEVERERGEPSLQSQLISPLHLLSLKKLRRNWILARMQRRQKNLQWTRISSISPIQTLRMKKTRLQQRKK
jgi:hypothetical protein